MWNTSSDGIHDNEPKNQRLNKNDDDVLTIIIITLCSRVFINAFAIDGRLKTQVHLFD